MITNLGLVLYLFFLLLWLGWATVMLLELRRNQRAMMTAMHIAESSRINSITSKASLGNTARDNDGRPIRIARERSVLKFTMKGGDNDNYHPNSRF